MIKKFYFFILPYLLIVSISLIASPSDLISTSGKVTADGSSENHFVSSYLRDGLKLGSRQTIIDSIPAPGSSHMGLGWDGTYLWNASNASTPILVYQIDPITGTTVDTIITQINSYVLGVTYLNGSLWIQESWSTGTTYEVDPLTGNTISSFSSPAGTGSSGLTNDGTHLWIFGTGGSLNNGTAYQVTTTGNRLDSCDISGPMEWPMGVAYNNQRGTFFVNDGNNANDINELYLSGDTAILFDEFAHPAPDDFPRGITYDGQYLWTTAFNSNWIWQIDIGDSTPPSAENILYVDDDDSTFTEILWEASFNNIGYPYNKWVVADSGEDVAPDSAAMANYTIVVWTTADDMFTNLTPTDTTEIGRWFGSGGKLWLSSQDVLSKIGSCSWMHLSGFTVEVGCAMVTGIDFIMSPLSFSTTGGVIEDYSDIVTPDGISWSSLINESNDTNSVAMDTTVGLPYFLYFNTFLWEKINDEADRDSMMQRILTWMGYPPPLLDVGTQAIIEPGLIIPANTTIYPKAIFRNFGEQPATFDVYFEINLSGDTVYSDNGTLFLAPKACSTFVFPQWTSGAAGDIVYTVRAYTLLTGDMKPSNDTLEQTTLTTSVSEWLRCADRPTGEMCHATCYDPVDDMIYAFGGYRGDDTYYNWTYRYDPVTDTWAIMASMPTAIDWLDASVIRWNRKIYIFGGYDGIVHNYNYIYDVSSDSWTSGPSLPLSRFAGGQVIYNDSLIYMLGGYDGAGPTTDVQIFNTYTDAWTTGTNLTASFMMGGVAILGDTIWLVGGTYDGSNAYSSLYKGVINPSNCESISWSPDSALPLPIFNNGATEMVRYPFSHLLVVGGFENATTITNHAWEYYIGLDTWVPLPDYPMTICRNDFLVARVAGDTLEVYVNGGDSSKVWNDWKETNQVWKLQWLPPYQSIAEKLGEKKFIFGLSQNFPNPFTTSTTITFTLPSIGHSAEGEKTSAQCQVPSDRKDIALHIYDVSGRLVKDFSLGTGHSSLGTAVTWDGTDNNHRPVAAGVYFYKLTTENRTAIKKMVIIR